MRTGKIALALSACLIVLPSIAVSAERDSTELDGAELNTSALQSQYGDNLAQTVQAEEIAIQLAKQEMPAFSKIMWWRVKRMCNKGIRNDRKLVQRSNLQPKPVLFPPLQPKQAQLTWLGHSSTLLRLGEVTILTDPLLDDSAAPVSWAGPERVVAAPLRASQLPFIDYVVISHNHYDHLDLETIKTIAAQPRADGQQTLFFVPRGVQAWFEKHGITNSVELSWWQTHSISNGLQFTAVPVQHHSGRGMLDHNKSLWSGWVIQKDSFSFFFAGDTGYDPGFAEIGKRFGPFTLAAIPIGGYAPRHLMKYAHINPEEAVAVHKDIGSKKTLAIHWGTFLDLTDEPFFEPAARLSTAVNKAGLAPNEFNAVDVGESIMATW